MKKSVHIKRLAPENQEEVRDYVLACRVKLFPMLSAADLPHDLVHFDAEYTTSDSGDFFIARDAQGHLIGTIGMRRYDHRFRHLKYEGQRVAEVTRLFVAPSYRKQGLGSLLFKTLQDEAAKRGISLLYLHTHPFLEGALIFWEKQGFILTSQTLEAGFDTQHLELKL